MELTNRELASFILLGFFLAFSIASARSKPRTGAPLLSLVQLFAHWKILVPLVLFLGWCAGLVLLAHGIGLWNTPMIKDTVILVAVSALPGVFYAIRAETGLDILRRAARSVLGMTALLAAYVNLANGPLWAEFLTQLFAIVIVGVGAAADSQPRLAPVARFTRATTVFGGLALITFTFVSLATGAAHVDWIREGRVFAMSVWLPLLTLPFVYAFALVSAIEIALLRLTWGNGKAKPRLRVRAAMVLGFEGRLLYASRFGALWPTKVGRSPGLRDARRAMREYRATVRSQVQEKKRRARVSVANIGKLGYDTAGLWLDRREFDETKDALESVALFQRSRTWEGEAEFTEEIGDVLLTHYRNKLPNEHGITLVCSTDGAQWRAWRSTPSGYVLGVGAGDSDRDVIWVYAAEAAPCDFPYSPAAGWRPDGDEGGSIEWLYNDGDIPEC